MKFSPSPTRIAHCRLGTTAVEMAIVLPVFLLFLFAIIEFGHSMMVRSLLQTTVKEAARMASIGDHSSDAIRNRMLQNLAAGINPNTVTIRIKDGSIFDNPSSNGQQIRISELPDIELGGIQSRQLFIVQISVPYESIALFPPFWTTGITLSSESVMRHE